MDSGSAIPSTTRPSFYALPLRLPPVREQRAIACTLGTLDDKIELNRRMGETLDAMVRAVFSSWFVDFDPVRAKMEGRDTGLPEDIADLFPNRLVDSEIGRLPDGWRLGRFGEIAEEVREPVHPLKHLDLVFRHFSFAAFDNGREPELQLGREIRSQKFRVPSDTVLVSRLNPETERVWLVGGEVGESSVCSTEFLVSRPRAPFGPNFLYCQTLSRRFRESLQGLATGTSKSHQRARPSAVLDLPVVLPPPALVRGWEETAEGILSRTIRCRRESAELARQRDALLPPLVSGTVRIPDPRWGAHQPCGHFTLGWTGPLMVVASLSQIEADKLLGLPKHRTGDQEWVYPGHRRRIAVPLVSADLRERFVLDLSSGRINLAKGTYQTRARSTVILARLDFGGGSSSQSGWRGDRCAPSSLVPGGLS